MYLSTVLSAQLDMCSSALSWALCCKTVKQEHRGEESPTGSAAPDPLIADLQPPAVSHTSLLVKPLGVAPLLVQLEGTTHILSCSAHTPRSGGTCPAHSFWPDSPEARMQKRPWNQSSGRALLVGSLTLQVLPLMAEAPALRETTRPVPARGLLHGHCAHARRSHKRPAC